MDSVNASGSLPGIHPLFPCTKPSPIHWLGSQLLKTPKVFLFPLFSVGVNLTFIALLNYFQKSPILNPLFQ